MTRSINPQDIGLSSPHFAPAVPDITPRIILNLEALEKCGKTTFALTAPDPIVVFNLDRGLEGVAQHALAVGKKVVVAGLSQGPGKMPAYYFAKPKLAPGKSAKDMSYTQAVADRAREVWRQFREDYEEALGSKARTLVIDTGTGCWELARYAAFGKLTQVKPHHYGPLKQEFQGIVHRGYDFDKNVIWIHRLKPEWADVISASGEKESVKTSRFERAGYSDMGFEVQANVRLEKTVDKKKGVHFKATILDCRLNQGLDGVELEDEFSTFPYLASTVFGNDVDEWE